MALYKEHRSFYNRIWQFGKSIFIKDASLSQHNSIVQVVRLPFTATGAAVDSGWDVPAGSIILDVLLQVNVAEAAETIDVGIGTDPDSLIDGALLTSTGFVSLAGAGATTFGVEMIASDQSGSNVRIPTGYLTASNLTYTASTTAAPASGYIYVFFMQPF